MLYPEGQPLRRRCQVVLGVQQELAAIVLGIINDDERGARCTGEGDRADEPMQRL